MNHYTSGNHILSRLLELSESPGPSQGPRTVVPLPNGNNIARIVFKDEGWDEEGRTYGPAYAENGQGDLVINYGWITRKAAELHAVAIGVELMDV